MCICAPYIWACFWEVIPGLLSPRGVGLWGCKAVGVSSLRSESSPPGYRKESCFSLPKRGEDHAGRVRWHLHSRLATVPLGRAQRRWNPYLRWLGRVLFTSAELWHFNEWRMWPRFRLCSVFLFTVHVKAEIVITLRLVQDKQTHTPAVTHCTPSFLVHWVFNCVLFILCLCRDKHVSLILPINIVLSNPTLKIAEQRQ